MSNIRNSSPAGDLINLLSPNKKQGQSFKSTTFFESDHPLAWKLSVKLKICPNGGTIKNWLIDYTFAATKNHWSSADALSNVGLYLSGPHKTWFFVESSQERITTWAQFMEAIVARFESPAIIEAWKNEFSDAEQRSNENMATFANRVALMADKAEVTEQFEVTKQLIRGLNKKLYPSAITFHLRNLPMEIIVQNLTELEVEEEKRKSLSEKQLVGNVMPIQAQEEEEQSILAIQTKNSAGTKLSINGNQFSGNGRSLDKEPIHCFYCNKIGHYKRDCRKRIADQQSSHYKFRGQFKEWRHL